MYLKKRMLIAIFIVSIKCLFAGWEQINPPKGGDIYKVLVNRENEEIIFAVSYSKVYKTDDGGENWYIVLEESSVSDIFQIAPSNQDVIYTENWKSTDGGESWSSITIPGQQYMINIQIGINPSNPDIVFCGSEYHDISKTSDGGENWVIVATLDDRINMIVYDENDSSILYAFGEGTIYKSVDNGDTWTNINNDIPSWSILQVVNSDGILYGINGIYNESDNIIKSSDGGYTWIQLTLNQNISDIHEITIYNNNIFAATDKGLYLSADDGITWTRISSDYDYLNTVDVYNAILVGSARCGVSKSSISEYDWHNIGVVSFVSLNYDTGIISSVSGATFLKDEQHGIYKYLPYYQMWQTKIPPSGDWNTYKYALEFSLLDEEKLICVVENELYFSTDLGDSWSFISEMPSEINSIDMAISNDDNKLFLNNGATLMRTLNAGESWSVKEIPGSWLYDIHYSGENILYILDNTGFYYSSNNGNVWNALDENLPVDFTLWSAEINYDINNSDRLFCVVTAPSTGYKDVYEKSTGAFNWSLLYSADEIIFDKFIVETNNNHIYATGMVFTTFWENSLFRSTDGGSSWGLCSDQFQFTSNITFSNFEPYLMWYIDTEGNIWTGDVQNMSGLSIENNKILTSDFYLHDAYPNPFNPITTISYQIAEQGHVNISIYNIAGQLVKTLVKEQSIPGSFSVTWNANNVNSGLYFYKLTVDKQTITKKILLLK